MKHFKHKRLDFKKLSMLLSDKNFGLSPSLRKQFFYILGTNKKHSIKKKLGI